MKLNSSWNLLKSVFNSWLADYAPSMGAALAYYTMFSIAPLLLIVISVAGLFFGEEAARGEIFHQLEGLMGAEGAQAVQGLLESANKPKQGIASTIVGGILLLVGATTVFSELQSDLDRIWRAPQREQSSGILGLLRTRLLSFGMILGLGFLMMVSLIFSAALAAMSKWWGPVFGEWQAVAHLANQLISFGFATLVFAMIYKFMPHVKIEWHDVWIGAFVTALLFTLGKFLISLYIGKAGVSSSFGAAGSLVILLVWVYYSAQIFLLGAEFTWIYSHTYGSREKQPRPEGIAPQY